MENVRNVLFFGIPESINFCTKVYILTQAYILLFKYTTLYFDND